MTFAKPEVGKPITITVVAITDGIDGYNNAEWKFRGTTPAGEDITTNLAEATALRQLARHGLDRAKTIGRTLEFAVTKQGVKKFYDINIPAGDLGLPAERSTATPRAAAPAATPTPVALDADARKAIIRQEKALLSFAFGAMEKAFPALLTANKIAAADVSDDAHAQCVTMLAAAFYQRLSARGLAQ